MKFSTNTTCSPLTRTQLVKFLFGEDIKTIYNYNDCRLKFSAVLCFSSTSSTPSSSSSSSNEIVLWIINFHDNLSSGIVHIVFTDNSVTEKYMKKANDPPYACTGSLVGFY